MADISKISILNGTTYDIKDTTARSEITTLQDNIESLQNSIPEVQRITNTDIDSIVV